MSKPLKEQILEQVSTLPQEQQQRILDFARALSRSTLTGVAGKQLLRFAGIIEATELQIIAKAIEDGCEGTDLNEW